jgi:hypothetical protein
MFTPTQNLIMLKIANNGTFLPFPLALWMFYKPTKPYYTSNMLIIQKHWREKFRALNIAISFVNSYVFHIYLRVYLQLGSILAIEITWEAMWCLVAHEPHCELQEPHSHLFLNTTKIDCKNAFFILIFIQTNINCKS